MFYIIKAYIIAKEYKNIKVYITKDYIIIRNHNQRLYHHYSIIKVFNHLVHNKPIRSKFNATR